MLLAVFAISSVQAFAPVEKKDFVGEWKFESPHAPEGYQSGKFVIREMNDGLAGEIIFGEHYKIEMKDVKVTDDVLLFGFNVDYNYIKLKATIEDGKLKGSAATPDGDIPFEAKKVVKTE